MRSERGRKKKLSRNKSVVEPVTSSREEEPDGRYYFQKRRSLSEADGDRQEGEEPTLHSLLHSPGALIHMYSREEEDKQLRQMIEELNIEYEIRKRKKEEAEAKAKDREEEIPKMKEDTVATPTQMSCKEPNKPNEDSGSQGNARSCPRQKGQLVRTQGEKSIKDIDIELEDRDTKPPDVIPKQTFFSMLKRLPDQLLPGRKSLKKRTSEKTAKKSFTNVDKSVAGDLDNSSSDEDEVDLSGRQRKYSMPKEAIKPSDEDLKDSACYIEVQPCPKSLKRDRCQFSPLDSEENPEVFTASSEGSVTSLDLLKLQHDQTQTQRDRVRNMGLSQFSLASTAFTDLSQLDPGCYSDSELCIDDESEMKHVKQQVISIRRPHSLDRDNFDMNLIPIAEDF